MISDCQTAFGSNWIFQDRFHKIRLGSGSKHWSYKFSRLAAYQGNKFYLTNRIRGCITDLPGQCSFLFFRFQGRSHKFQSFLQFNSYSEIRAFRIGIFICYHILYHITVFDRHITVSCCSCNFCNRTLLLNRIIYFMLDTAHLHCPGIKFCPILFFQSESRF